MDLKLEVIANFLEGLLEWDFYTIQRSLAVGTWWFENQVWAWAWLSLQRSDVVVNNRQFTLGSFL
ncbi:hypothetical protein [Endozoicomonas sp. ONNA2]|uniref:hypothetical protein n=1 Tax=Endozoicomonas sp. ONNA2 TaxID=2828741 RepID=UPI0021490E78|nr:hypothetical protein [Endozoicomonas sp. ONNA2]